MPAAKVPKISAKPQSRMVLVWLTLAVALVHLALLTGMPGMLAALQGNVEQSTHSFVTRTIEPEPQAVETPQVPPPVTAKASPAKPAPSPAIEPSAEPLPAVNNAAPTAEQEADAPDPTPASDASTATTIAPQADAVIPIGTPAEMPHRLVLPPSVRLLYDVKGVVTYSYTGGSELLWLNQSDMYSARLQITKFGFNLRTWTSKGDISWKGLEPKRFGDQTRSEIAAYFQREKGIVSFSANTPDATLLPGAQDYLSSFFQLAGLMAGEPQRYPPGSVIAFQVVNARSAEPWVFKVDGPETVELPDAPKLGIKLTREHNVQYDTKVELWLAPDLAYVPIRIRLSQDNGDFAELLWRSAQKPD